MPEADHYVREGDAGTVISDVLRDSAGDPVDIAGGTVRFGMAPINGGDVKVAADASNDQVGDGSDGTRGAVSYEFESADVDTPALYLGEWEFTPAGGGTQTYPNSGYVLVRVTRQILVLPESG